jgi:aminoglycoside phosphotransferase (APT) family kinase protein
MTRAAIARAAGAIEAAGRRRPPGSRAIEAPAWDGGQTWIHGDLLRPNLLVRDGRLHAVIDFGGAGAGDPATDVIAAWAVFGPTGRAAFRAALRGRRRRLGAAPRYRAPSGGDDRPVLRRDESGLRALARRTIARSSRMSSGKAGAGASGAHLPKIPPDRRAACPTWSRTHALGEGWPSREEIFPRR